MTNDSKPNWKFKIFIDYDCPLCRKEARLLEKLDRGRRNLVLANIADDSFDFSRYGSTKQEMMAEIHGLTPEGSLVTGVEVFRRAYSAVGWGWVINWTRLPLLRHIADFGYRVFARVRLRLPGRGCESGTCHVPSTARSHQT